MYSIGDLDKEIKAKVLWLEENNGRVLHKQWLINAVTGDHPQIVGDDADFALLCVRTTVTERVERLFREMKSDEMAAEPDAQMTLPGYKHLQRRYFVERDGERVGVLVWDVTDIELVAKAREHRAMGKAHFAHADEIDRFIEARSNSRSA